MSFISPESVITALKIMPGQRVVDFGAGSGDYVFSSAQKVSSSGTVYAVDIQKQLLSKISSEATASGYKQIKTIWADLEQESSTGLMSESIDVVIMSNILFQVDHKDVLIKEAERILKNKSNILIVEWSDTSPIGPSKEKVMSIEDVKNLFTHEDKFVFKQEVPAGDHHFAFIYSKK